MAVFARRTLLVPAAPPPRSWGMHYLVRPDDGDAMSPELLVARVQEAAANDADGDAAKSAATAKDDKKNSSPEPWATVVATVVFAAALLATALFLFGTDKFGPDYTPAEGIGVFALFYIVAQAAERLVEMVLPYVDRRPEGKNHKVALRNRKVVAAVTGVPDEKNPEADPAQAAADAQAEVDQIRANRTALVFGCTAAIGMLLCGYLEADFLSTVGVHFGKDGKPGFVDELLALAVTGLIVGGGSKALHDTISSISKSSDKKDKPPETGGTP